MQYRRLGKTGLMVSQIGLGAEWLERHNAEECAAIIDTCEELGINILDCWMSEPNVRTNIGAALKGRREKWYIQGHVGSTWQDGQYVRSREIEKVKEAFEDILLCLFLRQAQRHQLRELFACNFTNCRLVNKAVTLCKKRENAKTCCTLNSSDACGNR
mgnify:CR=1 FL=1